MKKYLITLTIACVCSVHMSATTMYSALADTTKAVKIAKKAQKSIETNKPWWNGTDECKSKRRS